MHDQLSNEHTTQEVQDFQLQFNLRLSLSVSKVSMIYLLVNLLCIHRLEYMRQQGLTAKIHPI